VNITRSELSTRIAGYRVYPSHVEIHHYAQSIPMAKLLLSGDERIDAEATDDVEIMLDEEPVFAARILSRSFEFGGVAYECGWKLKDTVANFRDEKASYIFDFLALQSGVEQHRIDLPDLELPHFHARGESWSSFLSFVDTVEDFANEGYDLFFDSKGVLNIREMSAAEEISITVKRGENALLISNNSVKAFPVPLGYGGYAELNEEKRRIVGLRYSISPRNSTMEVMF